jgi:hypothetical protein
MGANQGLAPQQSPFGNVQNPPTSASLMDQQAFLAYQQQQLQQQQPPF